jgi:hypothetical protein
MSEPTPTTADPVVAPVRRGGFIDRLAICISGLCVVHCVATLIFVTALAQAGSYILADPRIHETGLMVAIALAAFALLVGTMRHRRLLPLGVGSAGLLLMAAGLLVEHGVAEAVVTISGVVLVATAHRMNARARFA